MRLPKKNSFTEYYIKMFFLKAFENKRYFGHLRSGLKPLKNKKFLIPLV